MTVSMTRAREENHVYGSEGNIEREKGTDVGEESSPERQRRVKGGSWGDGDYVELGGEERGEV